MSNKKTTIADPHAEREANKYARPIVSREFILGLLEEQDRPLTLNQLAGLLDLTGPEDRHALGRRLKAMLRDGQIVRNRKGAFGVMTKMNLVTGRVSANSEGFGFLIPEDGTEDLYLSARQMRVVLHGDKAVARIIGIDRKGRREGQIVEVLDRAILEVVGRFHQEKGVGFVIPSDFRIQEIIVPDDAHGTAQTGQIVLVSIVEQPTMRTQPIGKIKEILGDHMAPGMEIEIAMRNYDLPFEWPTTVIEEGERIAQSNLQKMAAGREDLTQLPLVTIDGEDARDFDDAVYCYRKDREWVLVVAIADVASYVTPGSAMDVEAYTRGNSVYFPNRVIPMLPEVLSNGLCSLNPEELRLCLCCELVFSTAGERKDFRFFRGLMRSQGRLTYTEVGQYLETGTVSRPLISTLGEQLKNLHQLYGALRKKRQRRGAIEFETTETRMVFGEGRKIEQILPVVRNDAHKLIEEFMISANVAAAEFLLAAEIPAMYRIHEGPTTEKLADLRSFLKEFGLSLPVQADPKPKHFAQLLESVKERPDARLIQTILLRSMSQAIYSPENVGHFGLAYEAYTHFTSPIRRYPDLMVHRAIHHLLDKQNPDTFNYSTVNIQTIASHCSTTERRADEATRDAVSWLKCEYMLDKLGKNFPGIVTGVTSFGMFVELDDIFVEGLVHVATLDNDYYQYDPVRHMLSGERTHITYRIGDRVTIQVTRVDLDEKRIDFGLAEHNASKKSQRKRRVSKS